MTRKTLTIAEEAYKALARTKGKDESFAKVHPPTHPEESCGEPLGPCPLLSPDEELASAVEKVLEKRSKIPLRAPEF